jgi:hypothetical protein
VQAIVKNVIIYLNHVVSACVMNQSKGHGLLFDALSTIINLTMALEFEPNPLAMKHLINLMLNFTSSKRTCNKRL